MQISSSPHSRRRGTRAGRRGWGPSRWAGRHRPSPARSPGCTATRRRCRSTRSGCTPPGPTLHRPDRPSSRCPRRTLARRGPARPDTASGADRCSDRRNPRSSRLRPRRRAPPGTLARPDGTRSRCRPSRCRPRRGTPPARCSRRCKPSRRRRCSCTSWARRSRRPRARTPRPRHSQRPRRTAARRGRARRTRHRRRPGRCRPGRSRPCTATAHHCTSSCWARTQRPGRPHRTRRRRSRRPRRTPARRDQAPRRTAPCLARRHTRAFARSPRCTPIPPRCRCKSWARTRHPGRPRRPALARSPRPRCTPVGMDRARCTPLRRRARTLSGGGTPQPSRPTPRFGRRNPQTHRARPCLLHTPLPGRSPRHHCIPTRAQRSPGSPHPRTPLLRWGRAHRGRRWGATRPRRCTRRAPRRRRPPAWLASSTLSSVCLLEQALSVAAVMYTALGEPSHRTECQLGGVRHDAPRPQESPRRVTRSSMNSSVWCGARMMEWRRRPGLRSLLALPRSSPRSRGRRSQTAMVTSRSDHRSDLE